jgi:hypothetical protein
MFFAIIPLASYLLRHKPKSQSVPLHDRLLLVGGFWLRQKLCTAFALLRLAKKYRLCFNEIEEQTGFSFLHLTKYWLDSAGEP